MSGFDYSRFDKIVDEDERDRAAILKKPTRFEPSSASSDSRGDSDDGLVPYEDENHASEAEVFEIRSLKQNKAEIWQVAVAKLRCWVAASGTDGSEGEGEAPLVPVRPYTLFVSCVHPSGRLLTRYVARPPEVYPSPRTVIEWLIRAMLDPQGPVDREEAHRPGVITFSDPALGSHCAKTLSDMGIQTSFLTASPGLGAYVKGLSKAMVDKEIASSSSAGEREGMASVKGVTPQLLRGFYRLARQFAQAQPWRYIKEQQTLRVWRIPAAEAGDADNGRCYPGDTMSQCIEAGATAWVAVMGELSVAAAHAREERLARKAARKARAEKRKVKKERAAKALASKPTADGSSSTVSEDDKRDDKDNDKDDDAASFHSFSSDEREHGDSDKEGREEELEDLDDDDADAAPVASTRGLCLFFSRGDAEQRLLSAPSVTGAKTVGAVATPAGRPHPLDARCSHCGKRGREWYEAVEDGRKLLAAAAPLPAGVSSSAIMDFYLPPHDEEDAGAGAGAGAGGAVAVAADEQAKGLKLQRCGGCRKTFYCGPACQKAAWAAHSAQCKKDAASLKAGWSSASASSSGAANSSNSPRYWGERELVLLLEDATSLPYDDLDWYEQQRLQARRRALAEASSGSLGVAAADVSAQDAFYPDDLPLALTFHRGSPARPSPSDIAWLMRGMAAVMAMTATGEGAAATSVDDVAAAALGRRLMAHNLKPTLRPVSIRPDFRGVSSVGAEGSSTRTSAPEPWFLAAGEAMGVAASRARPPLLQVLLDPMVPVAFSAGAAV